MVMEVWVKRIKYVEGCDYKHTQPQLLQTDSVSSYPRSWNYMNPYCVKDNRLQVIVTQQSMVLIRNGKMTVFWLDTWIEIVV
jgi:hypothetical protein